MKRRKHVGCWLLAAGVLLPIAYCAGVLNCVIEPFWFREAVIYKAQGELFIEYRTEFDSVVSPLVLRSAEGLAIHPDNLDVVFVDSPLPLTWSEIQRHLNLTSNSVELVSSYGPVNISRTWIGYRVSGVFYDPRAPAAYFATHVVDRR